MDATPDPAPHDDGAARGEQTHEELRVTVRRSPKYGVFMAIGAVIGMVVAWVVSANVGPSFDESGQQVDTTPVVGLMLVVGFVVGGVLGAIVAIVVDRALSKGTRTVLAERVETREPDASVVPDASVGPATDAGEAAFERLEAAPDDQASDGPTAPRDDRPRGA